MQNMDAEFYLKILTEKFNEIRCIGGKKNWELQFDNDPKYKSKLDQEYLKKHKIVTLNGLHILQILTLLKIFRELWLKI